MLVFNLWLVSDEGSTPGDLRLKMINEAMHVRRFI